MFRRRLPFAGSGSKASLQPTLLPATGFCHIMLPGPYERGLGGGASVNVRMVGPYVQRGEGGREQVCMRARAKKWHLQSLLTSSTAPISR